MNTADLICLSVTGGVALNVCVQKYTCVRVYSYLSVPEKNGQFYIAIGIKLYHDRICRCKWHDTVMWHHFDSVPQSVLGGEEQYCGAVNPHLPPGCLPKGSNSSARCRSREDPGGDLAESPEEGPGATQTRPRGESGGRVQGQHRPDPEENGEAGSRDDRPDLEENGEGGSRDDRPDPEENGEGGSRDDRPDPEENGEGGSRDVRPDQEENGEGGSRDVRPDPENGEGGSRDVRPDPENGEGGSRDDRPDPEVNLGWVRVCACVYACACVCVRVRVLQKRSASIPEPLHCAADRNMLRAGGTTVCPCL